MSSNFMHFNAMQETLAFVSYIYFALCTMYMVAGSSQTSHELYCWKLLQLVTCMRASLSDVPLTKHNSSASELLEGNFMYIIVT